MFVVKRGEVIYGRIVPLDGIVCCVCNLPSVLKTGKDSPFGVFLLLFLMDREDRSCQCLRVSALAFVWLRLDQNKRRVSGLYHPGHTLSRLLSLGLSHSFLPNPSAAVEAHPLASRERKAQASAEYRYVFCEHRFREHAKQYSGRYYKEHQQRRQGSVYPRH